MKKKILAAVAIPILLFVGIAIGTQWSDYGDFGTSTQDTDSLLVLDVSDTTLAATGTQKQWFIDDFKTWLEVWLESLSPTFTSGTWDFSSITGITLKANEIISADIDTIVDSMIWVGGGMTPDGTQCAAASDVQINSGPYQSTIICADNDASTIYGNLQMPDSWDAGNLVFELAYIQTAADTDALNGDITIQCRGAGETVNNTWESEVAMDDAAVTGSSAVDHLTSGNVTGTCVAGDTVYWRFQMDASGTTTGVTTLHFVGMKMEYVSNVGD